MSSWALNNITTPATYTAASTLEQLPVLDHVNLDVSNAAIFWQLKLTDNSLLETMGTWDQEVFMLPGSRSLYRPGMVGVRVRSANAALPAQATIEAVES